MKLYNLPKDFIKPPLVKKPKAVVFPYVTDKSSNKNKAELTTHLPTFIKQGSKEIAMGKDRLKLNENDFVPCIFYGRSYSSLSELIPCSLSLANASFIVLTCSGGCPSQLVTSPTILNG